MKTTDPSNLQAYGCLRTRLGGRGGDFFARKTITHLQKILKSFIITRYSEICKCLWYFVVESATNMFMHRLRDQLSLYRKQWVTDNYEVQ